MKKVLMLSVAGIFFLALMIQPCQAVSSGKMVITGISVTETEIIVFASQYTLGSNPSECAATDWWWPAGTQYAFWFPRLDKEVLYTQFLSAYLGNKPVWIHAPFNERLTTFGNGVPCRVDPTKGATMGN